MRDDAAPGLLTQPSAPKAPGRLGREDARTCGGGTLLDFTVRRERHLEGLASVQMRRSLEARRV